MHVWHVGSPPDFLAPKSKMAVGIQYADRAEQPGGEAAHRLQRTNQKEIKYLFPYIRVAISLPARPLKHSEVSFERLP